MPPAIKIHGVPGARRDTLRCHPCVHAADRALTRPRLRAARRPGGAGRAGRGRGRGAAGRSGRRPRVAPTSRPASSAPAGRSSRSRRSPRSRTRPAARPTTGSASTCSARCAGSACAREVQDTVSVQGGELSSSAGGIGLARVRNVVALIPGTALDRTGLPGRALRLGAERPGRATTTARAPRTILETARALTTGPRAAQRRGAGADRRRGGLPVRRPGVRRPAPAGPRRRRGAQPGGPGQQRPGDHVRDARRTTPS